MEVAIGNSTVEILSQTRDILNMNNMAIPVSQDGQGEGMYMDNSTVNGNMGHEAQFSQHILTTQLQDERELNACQNNGTVHTLTSNMQRTENATPTLIEILNKLDKKLETSLTNIEGQLSNQNKRWQIIEQQLSSQNSRMNNIEQQMSQMNSWKQALSNTQNDVTRLNTEVFTVKAKMDSVKGKIETYDNSIQTYSDICDNIVSSNSESESKIDYLMDKLISMEISQNELQSKQANIEEKMIDLQWRGMRENLLFTGIDEPVLQRGEYENAEQTLRLFLRNEMGIDDEIPLDRVHRIGKFRPDQQYPRTIIAKFERYRDKEFVRKKAPLTLVNKPFGVNEHYPIEIENKRKLLYPEAKKARRNRDNKVRLIKDKLFVNGVEIKPIQQPDENNQSHHSIDQSLRYTNKPAPAPGGWQYRGRGRGRPRGRGITSDRGQNAGSWTAHSATWTARDRAFEMPTRNRFAPMRCDDDEAETPIARNSRKHQASSPLDADVNLKKHKEDNEADHLTSVCSQKRPNEQTVQSVDTSSNEMVVDTNKDKEVSTSYSVVCGPTNPTNPQTLAGSSNNSPLFDGPNNTQSGSAKTTVKIAHVAEQSTGENWD